MRKNKILWTTTLIVSAVLLIGYSILQNRFSGNRYNTPYDQGFYGQGMRREFPNDSRDEFNNKEKLSVDQIKQYINDYLTEYTEDLEIADIFIYKDSDYYISIIEKDTGRGAMEVMINPYTGEIYPEHSAKMMWNEKYNMHGGYSMMDNRRWNMMRGTHRYNSNNYNYNTSNSSNSDEISKEEAVKIADNYVKNNISEEFSVSEEGYKFYGYYTFYIRDQRDIIDIISVNYYTGEVWYRDWHGELEEVILGTEKMIL